MESYCQSYYRPQVEKKNQLPVVIGCAVVSFLALTYSSSVTILSARATTPTIARASQVHIQFPAAPSGPVPLTYEIGQTTQEIGLEEKATAFGSFNFNGFLAGALAGAAFPLIYLFKRLSGTRPQEEEEDMDVEASWAIASAVGEITFKTTAELPVKDTTGAIVDRTTLTLKTAGANSRHVIHRKLVAEMANRRESNAHTKTRGEVRGGGKKPYKQKGTGNARRGSTTSPLMKGGGIAFGPRNTKNYQQKINKKEGRLAISSLIQNRAPLITVIRDMEGSMSSVSTQQATALIDSWKDQSKGNKVLLVIHSPEGLPQLHPLVLSTNNNPAVRLLTQQQLCVTHLLWPNQILISEQALDDVKLRFGLELQEVKAEAVAVV